MQSEALDNWLNKLVSEGKITQDQANQFKQWWESRPNVPIPLSPNGFQGQKGFRGGFSGFPFMYRSGKTPATPTPSSTPSGS